MDTSPHQTGARRVNRAWVALGTATALVVALASSSAWAGIKEENELPGNPRSEWDISGGGDSSIVGFATNMSVNRGNTINFKIKTTSKNYRIDIYRLGYYGGLGARKVDSITRTLTKAQSQPSPKIDAATGLIDAGNWGLSASWAVPSTAVSGVYIAKLVRLDGSLGSNHIPFVVRDDTSTSDIIMQTSDTTWQAYNTWGGNSLYVASTSGLPGRAYKVSYNRPFSNRGEVGGTGPRDFLFDSDYPMLRWLEANGYDVTYFSGVDADRNGAKIKKHKLFISVGHDEYWSGAQRAYVEAARDAGVNLAFFSGNEVFWKTRWENSLANPSTTYRTLVSYKETHANAVIDPLDPPTWTGTWRDPRFSPPADGGRPENALTGTIFTVNAGSVARITVPAEDGKMRFWRNTSIANLSAGQVATLTADALTYEWDEDLDNGARPAGLIRLSATQDTPSQYLQDEGSTYAPGTATHRMTLYRAPSGALVFGAGTCRWAWGLDSTHDTDPALPSPNPFTTDVRMRQAAVNLFADMGIFPLTLQSELVPASKSTDFTAPTAAISQPASGATVAQGTTVQIAGTASDSGGVVGGVEVSTDNGATWHPANGRSNWSYTWVVQTAGTFTVKSRAVDDSGNLGNASPGVSVTVGAAPPSTTNSVWSNATVPAVITENDPDAVELGMKFRANVAGTITAIRFYKGSANVGPHVGNLWSVNGQLLGSVTFTNETSSGWQQASFATPVSIAANTTYVASYYTASGYYSQNASYFTQNVVNGPLTALASAGSGGNGVYVYGASSFPASTWNDSNYWVDLVFVPGS